jgi:hypothetical protein
MKQPAIRFRFTIRASIVLVFIVAVCSAFPVVPLVIASFVPYSGPLLAFAAFLFVRGATRSSDADRLPQWPSLMGWFALCVASLPLIALWFVRHRHVSCWHDPKWPRGFPYPDVYLIQIHDWWDRLHPAEPGTIKIHGEYYTVLHGINFFVLLACLIFGAVCGYVFQNGDFLAAARRLTRHVRRGPPGPSGTPLV